MNRLKNVNRRIAGFVMIIATLVSIGVWEFWGRENIACKPVLVLKEDIPANTIVSKEDFKIRKVESPSPKALTAGDAEQLYGWETSQYIPADTELRKEYFTESRFAAGEATGKSVMSLPVEWLMSCPQSLRRGDKISLYNGSVMVAEAIVIHVRDSNGAEVKSTDKDRLEASGILSHVEIIAGNSELVELAGLAGQGYRFVMLTSL